VHSSLKSPTYVIQPAESDRQFLDFQLTIATPLSAKRGAREVSSAPHPYVFHKCSF
jgi:hypothetical protein